MQSVTPVILDHIRSMGYAVSVHLINNMTEMHAVKICDPDKQHIARSLDGISIALGRERAGRSLGSTDANGFGQYTYQEGCE